jgi:hypothetical protein
VGGGAAVDRQQLVSAWLLEASTNFCRTLQALLPPSNPPSTPERDTVDKRQVVSVWLLKGSELVLDAAGLATTKLLLIYY